MTRIAEVRLVDENGEYGDVLPDWTALSYQDDADDVGAVTLTYPLGGLHAKKILPFQEMALFLDGRELPNGRFRLDQNEGDPISDGAGSLQWAGQTLMGRLATAMIAPDIVKKKEGGKEAADEERSNRDTRETSRDSERERRSDDVHLEDDGDRTAVRTAADDRAKDKEQKDDEDQKKRNPPQGHKFEKATPGEVVLRLARSAKRRGAIPEIRFGFTATHDSDGNKWRKEDDITRRFDVGSSLLDVVKWLAEADKAEARMETRTLNLYRRYTGRDRTGRGVMLAYGKNLGDGPRQADGRGLVNAVFAVSDTGLHGWVADKDLVDRDGRIEGLLSVKGVKHWEDLRDLAKKHIGKFGQIREQRTYAVKPGLGADPYLDYQVGDWLLLLEGSEPERVRVQAVTVEFTTSGLSSASVTLRDKVKSRFAQTAAGLSALMGATQSVHGGVALVANPTTRSNLQPVDDVPTKPAAPAVVARAGTAAVVTDGAKETGYLTNFAVEHIEVHVSEDEDFEPDDASYVGVLTGPGVLAVNGATVDQALYSRLVAVDVNGERSEPSDATAFESVRVTGADLAESTVTYREIAARTISGDLFQEDVVLSTRFSTGTIDAEGNISGARVDIAPEGLALTGADEQMLAVFPTTGARPFIDGDFVTRTLRVLEGASFESSANQVARGAAVVLASGVAAPAVSPLLREHWESVTLDTAVHAGPLSLFGSFAFNGSAVTGFAYCNGQYVIAQAVSLYYSNGTRLWYFNADGSFHHAVDYLDAASMAITALPTDTAPALIYRSLYSWYAQDLATGVRVRLPSVITDPTPAIAKDPSGRLLVLQNRPVGYGSDTVYVTRVAFPASSSGAPTVDFIADMYEGSRVQNTRIAGAVYGDYDALGASAYYFAYSGRSLVKVNQTISGAGVTRTETLGFRMPTGNAGLAWDGTRFLSLGANGVVYQHTNWLASNLENWYFAFSWYDSGRSNGISHETLVGKVASIPTSRRGGVTVTVPPVPDTGDADDPDKFRLYHAHGSSQPAVTSAAWQKAYEDGDTAAITVTYNGPPSGDGTPQSTLNPAAFPTALPSRLYSQATDAAGRPQTDLRGDGAARAQLLVPVGALVPWSAAALPTGFDWANGAAVSRTGYAELAALYWNGSAYRFGNGDGSTTFNLPTVPDLVTSTVKWIVKSK
jgi:hypothetical protein